MSDKTVIRAVDLGQTAYREWVAKAPILPTGLEPALRVAFEAGWMARGPQEAGPAYAAERQRLREGARAILEELGYPDVGSMAGTFVQTGYDENKGVWTLSWDPSGDPFAYLPRFEVQGRTVDECLEQCRQKAPR